MSTNYEKMSELKAEVEALVKSFNDYRQEENFAEAAKLDEKIAEKVGEHNTLSRKQCFAECRADSEGPMMAAIKRLTYPAIAIKDEKIEGSKLTTRVVNETVKAIDLTQLHKDTPGGIGVDEKWLYMAQKLNFHLCAKTAKDLGVTDLKTISDSYAMHEIARSIDMGKDPTSKTQILKTLQTVIAAMVGDEYKAVSHDVAFLLKVYSKKGKKALSVNCANHRHFIGYLAEICHRIVLDKSYGVEYKVNKA